MKHLKKIAAAAAVLAGLGLFAFPGESVEDRMHNLEPELNAKLRSRDYHIDPAELLDLIYNASIRLHILDVRPEEDFNLFHIVDSQRIDPHEVPKRGFAKGLEPESVYVLASNGESAADRAWKYLAAQNVPNIYILAGGINKWVEVYAGSERVVPPPATCTGDDCRRYFFEAALGHRHPASDPGIEDAPKRDYEKKVKDIGGRKRKSGGCG